MNGVFTRATIKLAGGVSEMYGLSDVDSDGNGEDIHVGLRHRVLASSCAHPSMAATKSEFRFVVRARS